MSPLHTLKENVDKATFIKEQRRRGFKALTLNDSVDPPEMQIGPVVIPPYMKYSSRREDNDIETVRTRLRKNLIFHNDFDPFLDSKLGKIYYQGVYEMNNPEHVEGTVENESAPKNVYAYNLQNNLHLKAK